MGLLNKLFGGGNKVNVHFIDASNGKTIGVTRMPPEQLPETFEIATTMHLNDEDWSVEEAKPQHSKDFLYTKELTLKMRKVEYINPKDLLYTLPTVSNEFPPTSQKNESTYNNFEYAILEDDWRQNEFLNKSSFPLIEIEFKKIEEVKKESSKETNSDFTAYTNCHVRDTIGKPNLELDFEKLQLILKTQKLGSLKIATTNQFISNGFSIKTENSTYYGIVQNDAVTHLCLGEFNDSTSKEINTIVNEFNLLFIGWYHCTITAPND